MPCGGRGRNAQAGDHSHGDHTPGTRANCRPPPRSCNSQEQDCPPPPLGLCLHLWLPAARVVARLAAGLYGRAAPSTVSNFLRLVESGSLVGTTFSRVLPGQYIMAGKQGSRRMGQVDPPKDLQVGRGGAWVGVAVRGVCAGGAGGCLPRYMCMREGGVVVRAHMHTCAHARVPACPLPSVCRRVC